MKPFTAIGLLAAVAGLACFALQDRYEMPRPPESARPVHGPIGPSRVEVELEDWKAFPLPPGDPERTTSQLVVTALAVTYEGTAPYLPVTRWECRGSDGRTYASNDDLMLPPERDRRSELDYQCDTFGSTLIPIPAYLPRRHPLEGDVLFLLPKGVKPVRVAPVAESVSGMSTALNQPLTSQRISFTACYRE